MNHIVKIIGTIVMTLVILGLPVLTCLSFVLKWDGLISIILVMIVVIEAVLVAGEIWERSEDGN